MTAEPGTAPRCVLGARERGDELLATAPPARRFLLLEVPGPWQPDTMAATGLGTATAAALQASAAATGTRILLIRRPGRHPVDPDGPRRWGIAALPGSAGSGSGATGAAGPGFGLTGSAPTGSGAAGSGATVRPPTGTAGIGAGGRAGTDAEAVPVGGSAAGLRWGGWRTNADLLDVDLAAAVPAFDGNTQRPVALVCTHGRHDLCCAIEGRPVVVAAAAEPRADVWECSHLGGDRFAANLLWLPSGLLFGGLSAPETGPLLEAALDGRVILDHYRGRCGDPQPAQAAQWHLMRAIGEDRPDRVIVEHSAPDGGNCKSPAETATAGHTAGTAGHTAGAARAEPDVVVVLRHGTDRYRLRLAIGWSAPHRLTCRARTGARARTYRLTGAPELL